MGEELVTRTGGDERGEEADVGHLPGTQGNFTLEYQNAKAGPGHYTQPETIAEDKRIPATRLDTKAHHQGKHINIITIHFEK